MKYTIKEVKPENRRPRIYVPLHKQYVELLKEKEFYKEIELEEGKKESIVDYYEYEVVRLNWREEFSTPETYDEDGNILTKSYIEQNFEELWNENLWQCLKIII